jgi:putative oxidoreductase
MSDSSSSTSIVPLAGRLLISAIFIFSGLGKLAAHAAMVGFAASKGLPAADLAIWLAAAIEIFGGLAILLGFQTRIAAWVLFLYLIPVSLVFHNFWALQGMERMDNQVHLFKNVAIMGGLLFVATFGAGAYSVDAARLKKA